MREAASIHEATQVGHRHCERLGAVLSVGFPALVYFGRDRLSPQVLALVLVLIVWFRKKIAFGMRPSPWLLAGGLLLAFLALGRNDVLPLKLYPVW